MVKIYVLTNRQAFCHNRKYIWLFNFQGCPELNQLILYEFYILHIIYYNCITGILMFKLLTEIKSFTANKSNIVGYAKGTNTVKDHPINF